MGSFSIWHWAIVILIVVLLFGRGKISDLMGDVAKGIKSFKKGLAEEDTAAGDDTKVLTSDMPAKAKDAANDKVSG
jgi:sec-independent protein translocase protein TatA